MSGSVSICSRWCFLDQNLSYTISNVHHDLARGSRMQNICFKTTLRINANTQWMGTLVSPVAPAVKCHQIRHYLRDNVTRTTGRYNSAPVLRFVRNKHCIRFGGSCGMVLSLWAFMQITINIERNYSRVSRGTCINKNTRVFCTIYSFENFELILEIFVLDKCCMKLLQEYFKGISVVSLREGWRDFLGHQKPI